MSPDWSAHRATFEQPLVETRMVREPSNPLQQYDYPLLDLYMLWVFQQVGIAPFPALPLPHTSVDVVSGPTVIESTREGTVYVVSNVETNRESIGEDSNATNSCVSYLPKKNKCHDKRYRCAYPGCGRGYAETDGVRKHARKKHPDFAEECKGQPKLLTIAQDDHEEETMPSDDDADALKLVEEFANRPPSPFDFSSILQ